MSELAVTTGRRLRLACPICGLVVDHVEIRGIYKGGISYHADPHDAPCGAPCFGAGARGRDGVKRYRAGEYHGTGRYPCPACERMEEP